MALKETPVSEYGSKIPQFCLPDLKGKTLTPEEIAGGAGLVVAFICNHCPYVIAQIADFVSDAEALLSIGVSTAAIMPNDYDTYADDNPKKMICFAQQHKFGFPYLLDEKQDVAREFGAVCTPDYFGFDRSLRLQYRGRLDNLGFDRSGNRKPELVHIMTQIAQSKNPQANHKPSIGCSIKWRQ